MDKVEKVKVFAELYELINYYYEYRDQPVKGDFDFFAELEKRCADLDLDYETVVKEFKFKKSL
ncbi:hypothetical protein [Oceanobacillus halophilus]|nr:hypothetical protein [Oceanobacillus halophilus]